MSYNFDNSFDSLDSFNSFNSFNSYNDALGLPTYQVGDRVRVTNGTSIRFGTVIKLWCGSDEERNNGHFGLDKYLVRMEGGGVSWRYGCDIKSAN